MSDRPDRPIAGAAVDGIAQGSGVRPAGGGPSTATVPARPSPARVWWLAIRPNTLPAAIAPVVAGLGAAAAGVAIAWGPAIGCLAVALLLQVAANLANDLADFRSGADAGDRVGPLRVAAGGLVTPRSLAVATAVVVGCAGLVGLYLVSVGGIVLLVVGVLAIVAALLYTGGPWPYGYHGLGEVFVFAFFGLVAVCGTVYLQAGTLDALAVLVAVAMGCLATAILVVNNLRDVGGRPARGQADAGGHPGARVRARGVRDAPGDRGGDAGRRVGGRARRSRGAPRTARRAARDPAAADGLRRRRPAAPEPGPQGDGAPRAGRRGPAGRGPRGGRPMTGRQGVAVDPGDALIEVVDAVCPSPLARIRVDRVAVPFRTPIATASGAWTTRRSILVTLRDAEGASGCGEIAPAPDEAIAALAVLASLLPRLDGLTPAQVLAAIEEDRAGDDAAEYALASALEAGIETALLDLAGRRAGMPVAALLAGASGRGIARLRVPVSALVSAPGPTEAAAEAAAAVARGVRCVKLKVGGEADVAAFAERVAAVRAAVGEDVELRLDANGSWTTGEAIERLRAVRRHASPTSSSPSRPSRTSRSSAGRATSPSPPTKPSAAPSRPADRRRPAPPTSWS